jgi:hypothetical protein
MKKLIILSSIILLGSVLFISCAKDEKEPEEETPVQVNKGSFSWTLSSGQTVNADSAHCYNSIDIIYAFKNGNSNSLEIDPSSLSAGSYTISSSTGNSLTFTSGSANYNATSGILNITSNSGNKLSGDFNVILSGGSATSMSGTFKDILIR